MAPDLIDPRRLASLPPRERLDALLSQEKASLAVRAQPPEALYRDILEVGLADAEEIVQLASPRQFRTFVDLGAWRKDQLDHHALLAWIAAARGDDDEALLAKLDGLDLESLELMLRRTAVVHDLEETPDVNPDGVTMESPEGRYLLEFKVEGQEQATLRALLSALVARDPFAAGRLFEALRWELDSELEETAYGMRRARLADLGFPPLEEAMSLFAWTDPDAGAPAWDARGAGLQKAGADVDYLRAALEGLDAGERENAEQELRFVVNQALVAEGADPGDLEAMRRVAESTAQCLSLGIEHLSGGVPASAPDTLRVHPFKRLFQVGFSLTLKLKFRVDRMARRPLARKGEAWLLFEEEARVVRALHRRRPLKAVKVEGAEPVPFRARRELQEAALTLDAAEAQLALFSALLGGTEEAAAAVLAPFESTWHELGAERLFASVLAQAILTGTPRRAPLPPGQLSALTDALFTGGQLLPAAEARGLAAVATLGSEEALRPLVRRTLARFASEWGGVLAGGHGLDPLLVLALPLEGVKNL
jgi:hypothetical protein